MLSFCWQWFLFDKAGINLILSGGTTFLKIAIYINRIRISLLHSSFFLSSGWHNVNFCMVFSSCSKQKKQDSVSASKKGTEDELTCSVCLEQVTVGEVVRTLPCLHQVSTFTLYLKLSSSNTFYSLSLTCVYVCLLSFMQSVSIHGLDSKEHVLSVNSRRTQDGKNKTTGQMMMMMMMTKPPSWFESSVFGHLLCY